MDIKRKQLLNMVLDGMLTFLAYFCAIGIRYQLLRGTVNVPLWSIDFLITAVFYSAVIVVVYAAVHLYSPDRRNPIADCLRLTVINGFGVVCLMALLYIVRIMDFSRLALAFFWAVSSTFVCLRRITTYSLLRSAHRSGRNVRHIAVVGSGNLARQYILDTRNADHCRIDGTIGASVEGIPHLGGYDNLEEILASATIDELVVALDAAEASMIQPILEAAGNTGTHLTLIPIFNEFIPANPTVRTQGNTTLINLRSTRLDHPGWALVKRAMDILGSLILILLTSPLMALTAIGVKLSSPGPAIFSQERIGLNKRPFLMYKFRSMRVNNASETGWSTASDPRKTPFGAFIRRYSLDELPQLFNVLRGDMSLVGPRPEIPYHVERFKKNIPLYLVRQQIRPGMTGWAQINGLRGDTSIEDRVDYDIWYIENWSLWLDIRILLRTAFGGMVSPAETEEKV